MLVYILVGKPRPQLRSKLGLTVTVSFTACPYLGWQVGTKVRSASDFLWISSSIFAILLSKSCRTLRKAISSSSSLEISLLYFFRVFWALLRKDQTSEKSRSVLLLPALFLSLMNRINALLMSSPRSLSFKLSFCRVARLNRKILMSSISVFAQNFLMSAMVKFSNSPTTSSPTFFCLLKISIKLSKSSCNPKGNPVSSSSSQSPFFSSQFLSRTGLRQISFLIFSLSLEQRYSSLIASCPAWICLYSTLQISKSFCPWSGQMGLSSKKFWRRMESLPKRRRLECSSLSITQLWQIIIIAKITPTEKEGLISLTQQGERVIFSAHWLINYILIEMIHGAEIRDLLKRRDRGKLDSYMRIIARKKEEESDLMNLLQAWVHSLLYYKQIYAPEAFHQRTILGVPVFVALSPPLREYLDDFFQKIKPHLSHLNHLRVVILGYNDRVVEVNTLHIEDLLQVMGKEYIEEGGNCIETNLLQKEMQFKSFLFDLKQQLELSHKLMKSEEELTFKLRIGYRHQINQKASRSLLDGWLLREDKPEHGRIACSLKSSNLNLLYQVTK